MNQPIPVIPEAEVVGPLRFHRYVLGAGASALLGGVLFSSAVYGRSIAVLLGVHLPALLLACACWLCLRQRSPRGQFLLALIASLLVLAFLVLFTVGLFATQGLHQPIFALVAGLVGVVVLLVWGRRSGSRLRFLFMAAALGMAAILVERIWSLTLFLGEEEISRASANSVHALQEAIGDLILRFSILLAGALLVFVASALALRHTRVLQELPPVR